LVPILVYLITLLLPLDEPLRIGLILLSTAAGAPFLPKLAEVAKGNLTRREARRHGISMHGP
jgi:BASS family bile acid:Na+ symporter